jgi:hypothetical protein
MRTRRTDVTTAIENKGFGTKENFEDAIVRVERLLRVQNVNYGWNRVKWTTDINLVTI